MTAPVVGWYTNTDVQLSTDQSYSAPLIWPVIALDSVDNVPAVQYNPVKLWNDKGGIAGSGSMLYCHVFVKDAAGGNSGDIVNGTVLNGHQGLLQAKSDGVTGVGIVDDAQAAFTRLSSTSYIVLGDIPSNTARHLHFKIDCPLDATAGVNNFRIRILYSYL